MKIEIDDNAAIVTTVVTVVLFFLILILGGCHITEQTKREAIKAGLVEKPSPGQATHWSKPD